MLDAFNNPRILDSSVALTEQFWFPVLQQWSQGDKERVHDLLVRLAPPSSAGIMFGVGAAAARLKADGETQFIIRRLCLLLLASPTDSYAVHMQLIGEKLVELFQAVARRVGEMLHRPVISYANGRYMVITFADQTPALTGEETHPARQ